jgi:hypothetical protein
MIRRATWDDYSELFIEMARTLKEEWRIEMPSYESLPSRELELAVDAWCVIQAQNLRARIDPPLEVRPWMLARLAMASTTAVHQSVTGEFAPPPLDARSIVQMLCGEWNGALREQWVAIGKMNRKRRIQQRVRWLILGFFAAILLAGILSKWLR